MGSFIYRFRWHVIGAWLVIFAIAGVVAPHVTSVLKGGGYSTPTSESDRAFDAISRDVDYRALAFTAVFQPEARRDLGRAVAAADAFRRLVHQRLGRTVAAAAPTTSVDRAIVFVRVFTQPRQDLGIPLTAKIRPLLPRVAGVNGYITGASAIFYDMEQVSDADLRRMEIITFPIALVVLLFIFGTIAAALVPVSMGPLTVSCALATVFLLGHVVDMSIFVLNTASMLGLGVAIDYSLLMVQRFREELNQNGDLETALDRTVRTAGGAITVSAVTVAIGLLGMTVFRVSMLTSLGIGGSLVVAISLACALTFLPALLAVLGPKVNSLRLVPASARPVRFWQRLAAKVMERPWTVILAVMVVVTMAALPAFGLRVGIPGSYILPTDSPSRVGDDLLSRHIGVANQAPVLIVLKSSNGFASPSIRLAMLSFAQGVCGSSVVAGVAVSPVINSPRDVTPCGRAIARAATARAAMAHVKHLLFASVFLRVDPSSTAAESYVSHLRRLPSPPGIRVLVGGQTAAQIDFDSFLYGQFPLAILVVVLSIFVTLAIAFRSLLLPLKAVAMNCLSVLAAYGAAVFVFQDGFLRGLFGFRPVSFLDSIVPVFLFCVLFGLSTDYEVFLLARVREEYQRTADNSHSVAFGLERTGRMITSAGLIMVIIFGAFAFANLVVIKELGLAMAVGVLVDATLIRALLVPAAMRILGRWNWWPGQRGIPMGWKWRSEVSTDPVGYASE